MHICVCNTCIIRISDEYQIMDGDKTPFEETTSELVVLLLYSKSTHFDH